MVVPFLKFLLFIIFFIYLPTRILFRSIKIESTDNFFSDLCITLVFGIVQLTLITLVIRSLGSSFQLLWLIPILSVLFFLFKKNKFIPDLSKMRIELKTNLLVILILLIGIFSQNIVMYRGGILKGNDYIIPSSHDTMWSLAITEELTSHFPPQNPSFSGITLKNHHYFYPLFLASIQKITGIGSFDLYFRLAPVLISMLFGLSIYTLSGIFIKRRIYRILSLFLGYFSGSLAFLLPIFKGLSFDWRGNSFFSDQPFDQIINPYSVLGYILFMCTIYTLNKSFNGKDRVSYNWFLLTAILVGSLYGFKSFGGIISILSFASAAVVIIFYHKKIGLIFLTLLSILLFIYVFYLITDTSKTALSWAPGWLLTELLGLDKLNLPHLLAIESFYQATENTLGLLKIKFIELSFYLFGNIGIRLLGLVQIFLILLSIKKLKFGMKITLIYLSVGSLLSLIIPLLFNLGSNAYNIIQFTPYSLVIFSIFTAVFCERITAKTFFKSKFITAAFIVFIILSAVPVNIKNIISKIPLSGDKISKNEKNGLDFLQQNTSPEDVILIVPEQFELDPIYVPALSSRRVYLASSGFARQTGINPEQREAEITSFFNHPTVDLLKLHNIRNIYLIKKDSWTTYEIKLKELGLKVAYENNYIMILSTQGLYV